MTAEPDQGARCELWVVTKRMKYIIDEVKIMELVYIVWASDQDTLS